MSLINGTAHLEKDRILEWANENRKPGYPDCDWKEDVTGYFITFDNTHNVMPLGFETVAELKSQLEAMWEQDGSMKNMAMTCAVAAFRNRPQNVSKVQKDEMEESAGNDPFVIPDFVYVF